MCIRDRFYLDGQLLLLSCPQGVKPRGVDFENVHQCTVMNLDIDFENNTCHIDDVNAVSYTHLDVYKRQVSES